MIKRSGKKLWIILPFTIILLLFYLFIRSSQNRLVEFLSKTNTVDANILVLEGWLPEFSIEKTYDEFVKNDYNLIVTTGLKSRSLDYCLMAMNGYLIFYPNSEFRKNKERKNHLIEIVAHSKMSGNYCSHFNFFINDSLVADFNADTKEGKYLVSWTGSLEKIDSLIVQFDNDYVDSGGDRNLLVKEIIIDNKIVIPYQFNSVYDIGSLDGKNRIFNNYESHAELARNNLVYFGIDSASVMAAIGKKTEINRTLASALAFRRWLKSYDGKVEGINIISFGIHSRRTYLTFKSVLDKSIRIGIISLPESDDPSFKKFDFTYILGEVLSLIYYWVILIPFEIS